MNKIKDHLVKVVKNDIQMASNLIYGRSSYPPKVLKILDKYGNQKITALRIYRVPLSGFIMSLINLVTFNDFAERMKNEGFDKLFHLRLDIKLNDGTIIAMEKLETVSLNTKAPIEEHSETMEIAMVPNITLTQFFDNVYKYMGTKKFFSYSSKDNNCQDFLVSSLLANNINGSQYIDFIKQDTDTLFNLYLRKLTNTITDVTAKTTTVINGGCINCDCGCSIKQSSYKKHIKSKRHNINSNKK